MCRLSAREICEKEYVAINGIQQFLYHRGTNRENPVLLFLHGGPGSSEAGICHMFQDKWEEKYTVVHWDQRGAGKTLTKNPKALPDFETMMADLEEVVKYLKKKYHKQKLVIMGHSWGTILGSYFVKKHPEEAAYYIGAGQVINMTENEELGYRKLKELMTAAKDAKGLKKLESIGEYPGERISFTEPFLKKCQVVRKLQGQYKLGVKIGLKTWLALFKSPIFEFSDLIAFMKIFKVNQKVYRFMESFDFWKESYDYQVPIYYILGEEDWQVPHVIAERYFEKIQAPDKKCYVIPHAGHFVMMDQVEKVSSVLNEICEREKSRNE